MPSQTLTIPTTSESHPPTGKPFTLYHITISLPLRTLTTKHRYSDFTTLHSTLTTQAALPPPAQLPAKSYFSRTVSNPSRTESRRQGLESYLLAILTHPDPRWRETPAWRAFLNLPSSVTFSNNEAQPKSGSMYAGLPTGPITDPTLWLDSHRTLKTYLHDARLCLTRREQATSTEEAKEATAEAKRSLIKCGALISALDAGLKDAGDGSTGLGMGEVRRRRDMVLTARKEMTALQGLQVELNNRGVSIEKTSAEERVVAEGPAKKALFGGRAGGGGGRVLGGPAPETSKTRELDNQGVLQLQKEEMRLQDEMVEGLLKTVQRQKEIGLEIGDELAVQNEMLDEVERDVDRMERKTKLAKKRADKIR